MSDQRYASCPLTFVNLSSERMAWLTGFVACAPPSQDYLLWNRLGSSLSNGNKPEESLGAYREALMLRPTYTRAIYNVGVACKWRHAHRQLRIFMTPSMIYFADALRRSEYRCSQGGRGTSFERVIHARDNRREKQAGVADAPPSFRCYGTFSRRSNTVVRGIHVFFLLGSQGPCRPYE